MAWILVPASVFGIDAAGTLSAPCPAFNPAISADFYAYLQPAASGRIESAMFGMVRDAGTRFHEGVDFKSVRKTNSGDSLDIVAAAISGTIAYICRDKNGSYGRYIVLQHTSGGIQIYTLYAHLSVILDSLRVGQSVQSGAILGLMGRTSSTFKISKKSAHLHFEIGLALGRAGFERWYKKNYGTGNKHGAFNGFNLVGSDPLYFFEHQRNLPKLNFATWVQSLPRDFSVKIPTKNVPAILQNSPSLLQNVPDATQGAGWEIDFTWYGLPTRFRRLATNVPDAPQISYANPSAFKNAKLRGMLAGTPENALCGKSLLNYLSIIFDISL